MEPIRVIDSHTEGEPTRVIVEGGPDLGGGSLLERRERFRRDFDAFRSAVVCEPRGSEVLVGALLVQPTDASCAAGVIFFNNVGYLGMCGHGAIGVVATLAHLGRIAPGLHRLETPVGMVQAQLFDSNGRVRVQNVPSRRLRKAVEVEVPGLGVVRGDVAWGGNWFFLTEWNAPIALGEVELLTAAAFRIRQALTAAGITGEGGAEIDHIELFGEPSAGADSRNFVLCPGGAYDRSPCGTGTSAKVACLAADGKLAPGAVWRQQSVIGSTFEASYQRQGEQIIPSITGRAFITGEARLLFARDDPFRGGIRGGE